MPTAGPIKRKGPRFLGRPHQFQSNGTPSPPVVFGGRIGLWINGVEYTAYLTAHSPMIRSTSYAQTGVFTFQLQARI